MAENEASKLIKNFTGGLNTATNPLLVPIEQFSVGCNLDIDINSRLKTRDGTRTVYEDNSRVTLGLYNLSTKTGLNVVLVRNGTDLQVMYPYNDTFTIIRQFDDVWLSSNVRSSFVTLPDVVARCLALSPDSPPIDIQIFERNIQVISPTTTLAFTECADAANVYLGSVLVVNKQVQTATFNYSGGVITATVATNVPAGSDAILLIFHWHWWAEAYTWFGENFLRGVNRFGVVQSDQHVQIPDTISSDGKEDLFNSVAYQSTTFGDTYNYVPTQQPQTAFDYSFSDATNYVYAPDKYVNSSPLFITFGNISNRNFLTVTDNDINFTDSNFYYPGHGYNTGDIVSFSSEYGTVFPPLVPGDNYYVKKLDVDRYELYTDEALTTKVIFTTPSPVTFEYENFDYTNNRINIVGHGFVTGDIVKYRSDRIEAKPLDSLSQYHVKTIDADNFELYFDKELERRVVLVPQVERSIAATNWNMANSQITTTSHLLFDSTPIRFRPTSGVLPTGITAFDVYYAAFLSNDVFEIYAEPELTTKIIFSGTPTDFTAWSEDQGTHTLVPFSGEVTTERKFAEVVFFSRRRHLPFNNGRGVVPQFLKVYVNNELYTRHLLSTASVSDTTYYTYKTPLGDPDATDDLQKYIAFESTQPIGVGRADVVRMINTQDSHVGISGTSEVYLPNISTVINIGSATPAYGLGDWADYNAGTFPSVGTAFQGRFVLGGLAKSARIVLSAASDSVYSGELYNYYQVTNNLVTPDTDPFDVILPTAADEFVNAMASYQSFILLFTPEATYRVFNPEVLLTSQNKTAGLIANKGALNSACVAVTHDTLLFVSDSGVYDVNVVVQGDYISAEISVAVRNLFAPYTNKANYVFPWMAFDKPRSKLYVAMVQNNRNEYFLVYDTVIKAFTVYNTPSLFLSYSGISYTDNLLGDFVLFAHRTICGNGLTRFNFELPIDFAVKQTVTALPLETIKPNYLFLPAASTLERQLPFDNLTRFTSQQYFTVSTTNNASYELTYNNAIKFNNTPTGDIIFEFPRYIYNMLGSLVEYEPNELVSYDYTDVCAIPVPPEPREWIITVEGSSFGYNLRGKYLGDEAPTTGTFIEITSDPQLGISVIEEGFNSTNTLSMPSSLGGGELVPGYYLVNFVIPFSYTVTEIRQSIDSIIELDIQGHTVYTLFEYTDFIEDGSSTISTFTGVLYHVLDNDIGGTDTIQGVVL